MSDHATVAFELTDHPDPAAMRAVAQRLGLVPAASAAGQQAAFLLRADATGLCLQDRGSPLAAPTRVDFCDPALQHRLRTSGKRQGIGKAVGLDKLPPGVSLQVLDATAGLGRDALVLAHLGCRVQLLERSPVLHAMLGEGLRQAALAQQAAATAGVPSSAALGRLSLRHAEARDCFAAIAAGQQPQPDVIYLDPMFPPRSGSAKAKKDITALHGLLGSESDLAGLLRAALPCARYRVVLKRPEARLDAGLPMPTLWLQSKATCFAVYVNSSFSSMRP
jgi:16S rRNA (guanine1516-N2)-methyltransferase